jgi:hypothetical protein
MMNCNGNALGCQRDPQIHSISSAKRVWHDTWNAAPKFTLKTNCEFSASDQLLICFNRKEKFKLQEL